MRKPIGFPECGDWRHERAGAGTEYEEYHCLSCGLIIRAAVLKSCRVLKHGAADREDEPRLLPADFQQLA